MTDCSEDRRALLFEIRRSIRYHSRRRQFFDRCNLATNAVSVVFGSATIYGVLTAGGSGLALSAAAVVTVMSSLNLVVGTTQKARLHEDLARRFIELEKMILTADAIDEKKLAELRARRLDIEAYEPPILRVLDSVCHNEMMRAEGYPASHPEFVQIKWWQRLFAQFIDLAEHRITSRGQSA